MKNKATVRLVNELGGKVVYPTKSVKFDEYADQLYNAVKANYSGEGKFAIEYDIDEEVWFVTFSYKVFRNPLIEGMPGVELSDTMRLEPGSTVEEFIMCVEMLDEKMKSVELLINTAVVRDQIGDNAENMLQHVQVRPSAVNAPRCA
jgi:hypothetical protein